MSRRNLQDLLDAAARLLLLSVILVAATAVSVALLDWAEGRDAQLPAVLAQLLAARSGAH